MASSNPLPRLALTLGDPNGIGPEILLRALAHDEVWSACLPVVIGRADILQNTARALGLQCEIDGARLVVGERSAELIEINAAVEHRPGRPDALDAGLLAGRAIERAARMAVAGKVDGVVTMPISKLGLNAAGFHYPGHTEMLSAIAGGTPLMILACSTMRVGLVTIHVPLADVPRLITRESVVSTVRTFNESLRRDWGLASPRVAVLGLNPHAGESGTIGKEEVEVIAPAVEEVRGTGIDASGPWPADGFFARYNPTDWDGVVAMYHDQGLIPLKMAARDGGVNITAGLSIVRTSPDHGTAYNIAGRGVASERSSVEAILLAAEIAVRRRSLRS